MLQEFINYCLEYMSKIKLPKKRYDNSSCIQSIIFYVILFLNFFIHNLIIFIKSVRGEGRSC